LKVLEAEFPRSSYQLVWRAIPLRIWIPIITAPISQSTKCGRYGVSARDFDYAPTTVRRSVERSLARLHTTYLDIVYLHDVEFVATSVAPRAVGNHIAALGKEAEVYGLQEGSENKVWGDGDQKVLDAITELRKMQEEGFIKHIGITGACPYLVSRLWVLIVHTAPGYPLPTLLRIALLVLHTAPYRPLDVVLSYCHLTLQNSTLAAFAPVLRDRARVAQVITASPLSMGLLTPAPPTWHPAPVDVRLVAARAASVLETQDGGLPGVAIAWAVRRADERKERDANAMSTVIGLSWPAQVHQAAAVWREVQEEGEGAAEKEERARQVIEMFEQSGWKDWSWNSTADLPT
jgi:D-arabinose 1-dehydrogenase